MCNFFSAVATKDNLYAYYGVNSHDFILRLAGIRDDIDIRVREPHFVKLELRPNAPMTLDFDKWEFCVDQDIIPDWFIAEEWRQKMIDYLKGVPTITDNVDVVSGQIWFLTGRICFMVGQSSVLYMLGDSRVQKMYDNSMVIRMGDLSSVGFMADASRVGLMCDKSYIKEMRYTSTVLSMLGESRVVDMGDMSRVVTMYDKSSIFSMNDEALVGMAYSETTIEHVKGNVLIQHDYRFSKHLKKDGE